MIYIVKVTEKVYERKNEEKEYCNIYAKKSGIIKTITVYKGTPLIKPGSYVKKGDLIVSGNILLNENVVSTVCASAKVYAESWYCSAPPTFLCCPYMISASSASTKVITPLGIGPFQMPAPAARRPRASP